MTMEIVNITAEICCALFLLTMFLGLLYKREWSRSVLMIVLIFAAELLAIVTDLILRILNTGPSAPMEIYVDYAISYGAYVFLVCCFSWYFFARFEEKGARPVRPYLRWWVAGYSVFVVLLVLDAGKAKRTAVYKRSGNGYSSGTSRILCGWYSYSY